jgi:pyruvate-ferredoxin/flavodoxin oxidoreductase
VCPHAAIRPKVYDPALLKDAPATFKSVDYKAPEFKGKKYTLQTAPEDCTGCTLCVEVCPAKDKANPKHKSINMAPQLPLRESERANFEFFLGLPDPDRTQVKGDVKGSQFLAPLFEFSGACTGCGETPYIKLLTQLFGDRLLIGNATGCSSIYGGNLPTTPYRPNRDGRGPAWNNSLFEDAAEFAYGYRLSIDQHRDFAKQLLKQLSSKIGDALVGELLSSDESTEAGVAAQRARVETLKTKLQAIPDAEAKRLGVVADYLVKKSVWSVGGDGWAYDIGYGGLDHVIHSGRNINLLVLDTEVYSNTGGQASKSTPIGATAKFAMAGKSVAKKDLGLIAMASGNVYVARIAFGANDLQTVRAFQEADSYNGPSLIIAYSHCIAHRYDLEHGLDQQDLAVQSGYWPLFRFDPRRVGTNQPPLKLDSGAPKIALDKYIYNETRYRMLTKSDPERAKMLLADAEREVKSRYGYYEQLAKLTMGFEAAAAAAAEGKAPQA